MYFTYREENRTFQDFGLYQSLGATVTGLAEPEVVPTVVVTYGTLQALGVQPEFGRWFSQADDTPGSPETVILTYGYWQRRFGGDPSVVGRTLTIDTEPHTVIGVMPAGFDFRNKPDLILPQRFEREANADQARMLAIQWRRCARSKADNGVSSDTCRASHPGGESQRSTVGCDNQRATTWPQRLRAWAQPTIHDEPATRCPLPGRLEFSTGLIVG